MFWRYSELQKVIMRHKGGQMNNKQDLVLTAEAARQLRVSVTGLRKWRREGTGPRYVRLGGRLIRYRQTDIAQWVEGNIVEFADSPPELA